jgi:hypothetical protein
MEEPVGVPRASEIAVSEAEGAALEKETGEAEV